MGGTRPGPKGFVEAAGGLVTDGLGRIAVVHRQRLDDWSFPKGHLDPGETHRQAALREVLEETGFSCEITKRLDATTYTNRYGHPKRVRYYAMVVTAGEFTANDEVDDLRWVDLDSLEVLSYDCDIDLARRRWGDLASAR